MIVVKGGGLFEVSRSFGFVPCLLLDQMLIVLIRLALSVGS